MRIRGAVRLTLAAAILAAGAGLGLAQEDAPAPASQNQLQASTNTFAPPTQLDIPPPEVAPPPAANETSDAEPPPSASNTTANVTDSTSVSPAQPGRPHYTTVVLQALDKVTAETLRFEARVNEPVRYKDLVITVHACETQASDEPYAQTAAHMEVQYQPEVLGGRTPQVARQVFRGWMFGDAPGLHPFEHPIYDVWVIACKTPSATPAPAA